MTAHLGTIGGSFEVFDQVTGRKKVDATIHAVQRYGQERGVIVGKVFGSEESTGVDTLVANVQVDFVEENGAFDAVGQIGGTSDSAQMPAVLQNGESTEPTRTL